VAVFDAGRAAVLPYQFAQGYRTGVSPALGIIVVESFLGKKKSAGASDPFLMLKLTRAACSPQANSAMVATPAGIRC
jgi:hypothetical protein